MQSCLEKLSIEARHKQMDGSSIYYDGNKYEEGHVNATSGDDEKGKGTGGGGIFHWQPDCSKFDGTSKFDYKDYNTLDGGNKTDKCKRNENITRSLYGPEEGKRYEDIIDTSLNRSKGQYVFGDMSKVTWTSPCK